MSKQHTLTRWQVEELLLFMDAYVRRLNDATLRVRFKGVRIGNAKYSRLAQINLKTRIITFSRYAIEHVPERGRRYLVIHELAHVLESSHNRRFWQIVAEHEPDYKRIDKEIVKAFNANVRQAERQGQIAQGTIAYLTGGHADSDSTELVDEESGAWIESASGIMSGGS